MLRHAKPTPPSAHKGRTLITLLMMLLTTATAWAQEHSGTTADELTWELTQDTDGNYTVLTIGGTGAMQNYGHTTVNSIWKTDAPWGYDITRVTIGDGVTSIGDFAFIGCENLASVTIGNSVASIGIGAINHCDQMTTVTLPASVTSIGYGAFENCQQLTRVNINHDGEVSLTGSLNSAFNAPKLQYIVFPSPSAVLANTKTEGNWARYSDNLRAKLGDYLFQATNEGGTPAYAITSRDDLENLATYVNASTANTCEGLRFVQTADITLSGIWTPIGKLSGGLYYFLGTYDGGGFNINGLSTNINMYSGLFGVIGTGGGVKNVNVVDCTVIGGQYVGGIAGYNTGGTIDNCTVSGTIQPNNSSPKNHFGGICGYSTKTIKNCTNFATIENTSNKPSANSGGIAGYNAGSIQDCFTVGTINISDNGSANIGMVVGRNTSKGTISGTYYYAGTSGYDAVGSNGNTTEGSIDVTRLYIIGGLNHVGTAFNIGSQTYFLNDGYFEIADEQDLIDLGDFTASNAANNCEGLTFKLTADLDFTNMPTRSVNVYSGNFHPIGLVEDDSFDGCFSGYFDGQNHTIKALCYHNRLHDTNINAPVGLFKRVDGSSAVVERVILIDPQMSGTNSCSGGIAGVIQNGATIRNCTVLGGSITCTDQGKSGGIVGTNTSNAATIEGCTVIGTSVRDGMIIGFANSEQTIKDCIYYDPDGHGIAKNTYTDGGGNQRVYQLTLGEGITATSTPTYSTALLPGKAYYANGTAVTLSYSGTMRDGYDLGYTVNGTAIDGSEFNMPANDVTVGIEWTPSETVALTANLAEGNYWTTFYCGDAGYKIDDGENAWAYTATVSGNELTLHKLGKVIPKQTAVILVGSDNEISMTASTETVSDMPANSLDGEDVRTALDDIKTAHSITDGTFYVMSKVGGEFGFFEYKADYMPARKAYLLVPGSNAAPGLKMVFDEPTGITPLLSPKGEEGASPWGGLVGVWYTLSGTRLDKQPTQKGIYIVNGKKVVVK